MRDMQSSAAMTNSHAGAHSSCCIGMAPMVVVSSGAVHRILCHDASGSSPYQTLPSRDGPLHRVGTSFQAVRSRHSHELAVQARDGGQDTGGLLLRLTGAAVVPLAIAAVSPKDKEHHVPLTHKRESVWDYPRPPVIEAVAERISVCFAGVTIADTARALRVLETSHPPVYYLPPEDVRLDLLVSAPGRSFCEFKGEASYVTIVAKSRRSEGSWMALREPDFSLSPDRGIPRVLCLTRR